MTKSMIAMTEGNGLAIREFSAGNERRGGIDGVLGAEPDRRHRDVPRRRPDWRRWLARWDVEANWNVRRRRRLAWVSGLLVGLGVVGAVLVVWGIGASRS